MVKRQADKQLTDRNCNESDGEEAPPSEVMKTASPQVISKRQIRALPGRGGRTPTSTGAPKMPAPLPNPKTTWSPFDQASQPAPITLFGGSNGLNSSQPKLSLFGSSSAISPSPSLNLAKPKLTSAQALTNYYASLRGLNLSVLKAFEDLTERDAFVNLSTSFYQLKAKYDQYRVQIKSEYDLATSSTDQKDQIHSSSTANPTTTATPLSFLSNGTDKASKDETASTNSSLYNNSKPLPLTFTNALTGHNLKTVPPSNPFAMAAPVRPSPLRYGNEKVPAGSLNNEPSDLTSKTNSNVTLISDGKPAGSLFSMENTATQKSKHEEKSTDFSAAPPSVSTSLENKGASLFETPATITSSTSVFGTTKPFSFVSSQAQSSVNKPPSIGFGFGASAPINVSVFGSFGSTKNSITQATPPKNGFNPVGFSFGNSPPTSTPAFTAKIPDPPPVEKETIANKSPSTSENDVDASGSSAAENVANSDALETTEQSLAIPVSNKGEEQEETLYETSGRVYALMNKKQDDGSISKGWVGWAVCNVKLNRHKESKKCRILARSQVNQGILINFFVRADLKPENRGSSLEILGFNPEGTHLQAYRIRPSSDAIVQEFINSINQVVKSF